MWGGVDKNMTTGCRGLFDYVPALSKLGQVVMMLIYIQDVFSSTLCLDTDYFK
jgi:hypothetical protein